jgi:ABC-2 type transport system permease protein
MNLSRIQTIIDKEWAEVFKNRMVVFTVLFIPLIFTLLPLGILYTMQTSGGLTGDTTDMPATFTRFCGALKSSDCMLVYILDQFLLLYMIMPMSIPVAIAAYSVVGEKTTRSLEPLLATPVTTTELLLGKGLAAALPGVAATWGCFAIFALALRLLGTSPAVVSQILGPVWLTAVLVAGPLMAILAVNFALVVSSRVSDPRAAEQISMVVILPILAGMFGQIGGLFVINAQLVWLTVLALLLLDIGAIYAGVRLFQREAILTRWK